MYSCTDSTLYFWPVNPEPHLLEVLEVVILTGRIVLNVVVMVAVIVAGAFAGVVVATGNCARPGDLWPFGASRRTAAHAPQLVGEGPPPTAVLTYRAQDPDELSRLLPVRSSLALAPPGALLVHGGQHLTDVRSQQIIHLVALQVSWKHTRFNIRMHWSYKSLELYSWLCKHLASWMGTL